MSGQLSAEELAMLRYGEPLMAACRAHNALVDHIDALAAENDALQRRLAAAEAGIAAEIAKQREFLKTARTTWGFSNAETVINGLEIAARIVAREETP